METLKAASWESWTVDILAYRWAVRWAGLWVSCLDGQMVVWSVDVTVEWSVASMVECWVRCLDPNEAAGSV